MENKILEELKTRRLDARKVKDTIVASFLSTVLGDIQRRAEKAGCKDAPTKEVTIAELKAYVKRYKEEEIQGRITAEQLAEKQMLEQILPSPATEDDIILLLDSVLPTSMKDMKEYMAVVALFDNVDKALATKLFKEYISSL